MSESSRLEYKRELTDKLEREVVAFLNSGDGGFIYIGIEKDGTICGVKDPDTVQLTLKDRLKNNVRPSIMGLFDIHLEKREDKVVIRLIVAGGLEKPYYLKKYGMTEKGCFLRVGSASEPMPPEMIESFYGKRVRNTIGKIVSPRSNLTFEQLKIYYEARGLILNDAFMQNLELLTQDDKPNYAAYLLADDNGASLQVAKYADATRVDLVENRDYGRCSLVKALKSVLERVAVENTIFTRIGYPLREEREMINATAIREAVMNAVVHNDYSYGATPKIEFFSDRVEITSMGGLPYGVSRRDFFGGFSVPRNKEIMRVFRDLEIVEQLGSGIPRILEAYGREVFEIKESFLRIVLPYAKPLTSLREMTLKEETAFPTKSGVQSGVQSGMTLQILDLLASKTMSKTEIAIALGKEKRTRYLSDLMKRLLEAKQVEYTIPEKPNSRLQKYRLTEQGKRVANRTELNIEGGE